MRITPEQVDAWRVEPTETQALEFKEAKKQFDTLELFSYCVAIANEGGGKLILGISNQPPREVVGTNAFQNPIKITESIFQKLRFRVDVEEVSHPSGRVVVFSIPPRPRGTAYALEGRYLMRSGESLTSMSEDQLRKIFGEGRPDWLQENSLTEVTVGDVSELLDTVAFFKLLDLPYPDTRDGVLDRLLAERMIEKQGEKYAVPRLAGILLAKDINDFPDIKRKAVRVVVYTTKSKAETKLDQSGGKGYAVGFRGLVNFVLAQLPQNEVIKDALRVQTKLVPEIAIREIVANALIHQDFSITGAAVAIEIYSNRIEISNPGSPIVMPDRFIDQYRSRNERLADLMRRMRICEEKGCGIDKTIIATEMFQLPAPSFRDDGMRTQVVLYGPMKVEAMDKDDRIRACYQHCALKYVMSERMTNQSLRKRFGLPEAKSAIASQIIGATIDHKLIRPDEKIGFSKKFARYVPYWA